MTAPLGALGGSCTPTAADQRPQFSALPLAYFTAAQIIFMAKQNDSATGRPRSD